MKPKFFKTANDFREWLEKNHSKKTELLVGFYKVDSGKPSITYDESVEQALCYGWIDGVRKSFGPDSYTMRFTPRKPKSNWSAINVERVKKLLAKKLMRPAGIAAYEKLDDKKVKVYSYENAPTALDEVAEKKIKKNKAAWEFYQSTPPSYKKMIAWWISNAKQEKTRESRLQKLIEACEKGKRL